MGLQSDLARQMPSVLPPAAVDDIIEPPHAESDSRLLVSLVFTKPGRYHLYTLKVDYVQGGQRYWNYVRADIIIRAVPPNAAPADAAISLRRQSTQIRRHECPVSAQPDGVSSRLADQRGQRPAWQPDPGIPTSAPAQA
jgi:hypothetical protein